MNMPILTLASGLTNGLPIWAQKKENGHVLLQQALSLYFIFIFSTAFMGIILYFPLKFLGYSLNQYVYFILCSCVFLLSYYFDELFIAKGMVSLAGKVVAFFEIIKAVSFLIFAFQGMPIEGLFLVYAILLALKCVVSFYWLKGSQKFNFIWIESVKRDILDFSFPLSLSNLLTFLLDKSDQLILTFFASKAMFGYYSIGCLLIPPLLILEQSVTRVVLPQLSEKFIGQKISEMTLLYRQAVKDIAWLNIPGAIGLMIFAKPIITLLFGANYESAVIFTRLFSFYYLSIIFPPDVLFRSMGDSKTILKLNALFAPLSLGLCLILSFYYQAYGALIAYLLMKPIRSFVFLALAKSKLEIQLRDLLPTKDLAKYLSVSFALGLLSFLTNSFFPNERSWFFVMGGFFFLFYLTFLWSDTKHFLRK
jgi:O-antigen/teichoic acid export membrane protein